MDLVTETILDEEVPQARLGLLLKHFCNLMTRASRGGWSTRSAKSYCW